MSCAIQVMMWSKVESLSSLSVDAVLTHRSVTRRSMSSRRSGEAVASSVSTSSMR